MINLIATLVLGFLSLSCLAIGLERLTEPQATRTFLHLDHGLILERSHE